MSDIVLSRRLLIGAATSAIVAMAMTGQASAQSFQGTPTVTAGGATVSTSPNNTTVNINNPVTVINWTPDDSTGTGVIAFQPVGTTARFQSINFADFAVLNRILPVDAGGLPVITRPIRFDGTVASTFGAGSGITAGSVWFYTPGGIILGASSAFNVGSLVLSTSDISPANVFVGNNGTINFTGTPNPNSAITLENGAQVSALINGSSYIAMVAPRIVQNGTVRVDGSAALVAAEAVDITMDGGTGLFDIAVSTGASDANGIVHGNTGTTTGPASAGAGDPQRIYMMAIPKNAAISMLVNGNIGYTPAATATVQNGEVILSAGYDIVDGNVNLGEHAAPVGNGQANMVIGETSNLPTSFSTRVIARASGNLLASPGTAINGPNVLAFSSSAFLFGDLSSVVETTNDEFVGVGGDLLVSSRRAGQGGSATVQSIGGQIAIGGDLTVDATSIGFSGQPSGISLSNLVGANGRGGNASITVTGGALQITGATQVAARGVGGYGTLTMGDGFGGNATVNLSGTSSVLQFGNGLDVQGGGFGITSYLAQFGVTLDPPEGVDGGDGTGGSATVSIDDVAALALPGLIINASGFGDNGGAAPINGGASGGTGGVGTGGGASLAVSDEVLVLTDLTVEASGFGGDGGRSDNPGDPAGDGGTGNGGGASIALTGTASLTAPAGVPGGMAAVANGNGGRGGGSVFGSAFDSGSGGAAAGGSANISVTGSALVDVEAISALADARSGTAGTGGSNFGGTGVASGGNASILIGTTSTVNTLTLTASASTITYQTSRTGAANGGNASILIADGTVTADEINVLTDAAVEAEASQNVGSTNGMQSGNGTGGTSVLSVDGGSLTVNNVTISATGTGVGQNPDGSANITAGSAIEGALAGGSGRGNVASFSISGGSANFVQSLVIDASGKGGNGYINADTFATQPTTAGAGGVGTGGTATLSILGGNLTAPTVNLLSNGTGGNGGDFWGANAGDAGAGGAGDGGRINFTANQDVFAINALSLSALGRGGIGGTSAIPIFGAVPPTLIGYGNGAARGGRGGTAIGGDASILLDFDPVLASLIIDTSAIGGVGGAGLTGGNGGDGFGGSEAPGASLRLNFGDLSVDALVIRSNGTGGDGGEGKGGSGGNGGEGGGGDANLRANGAGANLITLAVLVQANGIGGSAGISGGVSVGGTGGNASGGDANIIIANAATANLGATRIESLANGGAGSAGAGGLPGGAGGVATGGNAAMLVTLATAVSDDIFVQSDTQGGVGGGGANGGSATGGSASISATTGSFSANDVAVTANGRGGLGTTSTGGSSAISAIGGNLTFITTTAAASGETDTGTGGLVTILAARDGLGNSGTMSLGDAALFSDGINGAAGTVRINNDNGDPTGGTIQFASLLARAEGNAAASPGDGIFVRTNQSDILVTGNATLLTSEAIGIDSIGQGTFAANGSIDGSAVTDIVITHNGQPGLVDTVRAASVSFLANRNFDAQAGSIIRATDFIDVQATNGFANVDQLFAVNSADIIAGRDATLRNANVAGGSLRLSAGRVFTDPPAWRRATATVQGAVTVSDRLVVNAGGDVVVSGGAAITTGNAVVFNSGDDIIIRNSTINSAQNVTTSGEIQFNSGAITPIDAIPGEIRSIVIANSILTSTGYDLNLVADAIDATTATINANRFTATINNPPAPGVAGGNDGGLLAANCVQGNICLGAISTPTQILVGPATGTLGLANRVTMTGSLASNNISIRARDGVAFAGPINVVATNNLLVSVLNGPIDLTGAIGLRGDNSLNLYAGAGAITGPNTALVSNGNIGLFASGGIALGSIDTGGVLNTITNAGSVAVAGSLVTPGNVAVTGQIAVRGGPASINSGGSITTGGILTTAGNDVLLTSTGAQSLGTVVSGRDVVVNAASLNAAAVTATRNVSAVVSGSATLGNTSGNAITLRAGQDATFNGSAVASTNLDVRANGQAAFNGVASAPNIAVRSGNIAIGSSGRIGTIGVTQTVTLTNSAGAQMTIGGNIAGGYSLTDAEIARIFADNIDIAWTSNLATTGAPVTPPAGGFAQPSITLGSLSLTSRASNASGNLATNGALTISTPGTMQVVGAVALNGAGAGNSIRLNADQSLQIIAGQGSLAVRDGAGGLAGSLVLNSANIIAASASATADIAGLTDASAITTRLGNNDGNISDVGMLSADQVNLNGGNSVFVQNSGISSLFRDSRGITANAINVSLTNRNGLVVINGRITAPPGFAAGLEAIPLLNINGTPSQLASGFDTLSTMNGCQITAIAACRQRENPISVTDDDINRPLDPDQRAGDEFPTALIELKEFETFGYPPLIDEPVTGSGNDDLWPATCPRDDETCETPLTPPAGN